MSPAQRPRFLLLSSMAVDNFLFQQCLLRQNEYFLEQNTQFQMSTRHYLHMDKIESLECLKQWFRAGISTYMNSLCRCKSTAAQNFGFSYQITSRLIRTVKLTVQFDNFDNSWSSPKTELNGLLPALVEEHSRRKTPRLPSESWQASVVESLQIIPPWSLCVCDPSRYKTYNSSWKIIGFCKVENDKSRQIEIFKRRQTRPSLLQAFLLSIHTFS